jgi:hypothetical protein
VAEIVLALLDPEADDPAFLQNVGSYLSDDGISLYLF